MNPTNIALNVSAAERASFRSSTLTWIERHSSQKGELSYPIYGIHSPMLLMFEHYSPMWHVPALGQAIAPMVAVNHPSEPARACLGATGRNIH